MSYTIRVVAACLRLIQCRWLAQACVAGILLAGCGESESEKRVQQVWETCPQHQDAEDKFAALNILDEHGPLATSLRQREAIRRFLDSGAYQDWCHDHFRGQNLRMTGPIAPVPPRTADITLPQTTAFSTHSRVRVFYSDDVVKWLAGNRQGEIPDGAVIFKEMHPSIPTESRSIEDIDGYAIMVRDKKASKYGWLWYLQYDPGNSAYNMPFRGAQYGNSFCMSCHAAAESESTFADWGNLVEKDVPTYLTLDKQPGPPPRNTAHGQIRVDQVFAEGEIQTLSTSGAGGGSEPADWDLTCLSKIYREDVDQDEFYACLMNSPITIPDSLTSSPHGGSNGFSKLFAKVLTDPEQAAKPIPARLPQDLLHDHVPPGADQPGWISASACNACHEASDLLNGTNAEMSVVLGNNKSDFDLLVPLAIAGKQPDKAALSPFAEWSGSLMSVSARDPVFRAQLEWETSTYPQHSEAITGLCLSCHAPAGSRAHPKYSKDLSNTYANAYNENQQLAEFGALARDGVTCLVCHRMTDENLGTKASFTANFKLGDAKFVNGPFPDEGLQIDPMQTGLGVTPRYADHIDKNRLCGTCHMVDTPVYDDPNLRPPAHEQTTFLEWRNSIYATEGDKARTCQGCHMPNTNPLKPGELTAGKIANFEDSEFPFVPNRKAAARVDTIDRPGYQRHTLVGINLFTMNLFQQFPYLLGSHTFNPARQYAEIAAPRAFATNEVLALARDETAALSVSEPEMHDGRISIDVEVTNKAGHKFPTGVGFRRAFLEVSAHNAAGQQIWCSGCTDETGLIVDADGQMLPTEIAIESKLYQPDYEVIEADDQVQIYETRHTNYAGYLTTSFVELNDEVKDNRLLPKGWQPKGFPEFELEPVGAEYDRQRPETDTVRYLLPREVSIETVDISVKFFYQALPPYYLLDRVALLESSPDKPETRRLLHMLMRMNLESSNRAVQAIQQWRLQIAQTRTVSVRG